MFRFISEPKLIDNPSGSSIWPSETTLDTLDFSWLLPRGAVPGSSTLVGAVVDGEVNQPMLLILNPPQLKNRGAGLR